MPKANSMCSGSEILSRRIIRSRVIRDGMLGAWLPGYGGRTEFDTHLDGYL
jgi:hypothetical protein